MTRLINYYYSLNREQQIYLAEHYKRWIEEKSNDIPHHVRRPPYCGMGLRPPDIFCIPIDERKTHSNYHASWLDPEKAAYYKAEEIEKLKKYNDEYFDEFIPQMREEIEAIQPAPLVDDDHVCIVAAFEYNCHECSLINENEIGKFSKKDKLIRFNLCPICGKEIEWEA